MKTSRAAKARAPLLRWAAWGPGLLVMLSDTDAGNVVTAAHSGARWGYRLLPLTLALIPPLYMVQELTVRLGVHTGRGFAELVRERYGAGVAWLSVIGLGVATIGSLVTEFTGIAGVGELFGASRSFTLPIAGAALLAVVASGSYRRVEQVAIIIGLAELAFLAVAWSAHPQLETIARDIADMPLEDRGFLYLSAAIIGMTFNPWMIFYQQSAVADKGLRQDDYISARLDTAAGAVLTQLLSAAVLVACAAALDGRKSAVGLETIGEISAALSPILGHTAGRLALGLGVIGGAMAAAIVASLALAWGVGEVAGYERSLEGRPFQSRWFYCAYAASTVGAAALVWTSPDLVGLNIAAQVLNAFLLPAAAGLLAVLAATAIPSPHALGGWYLWLVVTITAACSALGLLGGIRGLT